LQKSLQQLKSHKMSKPTHRQEAEKEVVSFEIYKSLKFLEGKLATGRLTSDQVEKVHLVINEIREGRAIVRFEKDGTVKIVETKKIPMRLHKAKQPKTTDK
jgi:hypothetical protein